MSRFLFAVLVLSSSVFAQSVPHCRGKHGNLSVNNDQVLDWKETSKEQYHDRAHVLGVLVKVYPHKNGHAHFSVRIGEGRRDTVEVIYNESFGEMDNLHVGAQIEACGDYITSRRPTPRYPASPDGAIVHWVHRSSNPHHPSGFVVVDDELYGQDAE